MPSWEGKSGTWQPLTSRDQWAWGHTSVILALTEAEAEESQVLGQPGLHKQEREKEGKMGRRERVQRARPQGVHRPCSLMILLRDFILFCLSLFSHNMEITAGSSRDFSGI